GRGAVRRPLSASRAGQEPVARLRAIADYLPPGAPGGNDPELDMRTVLCDLLGTRHPIIQDGMGPFSTAALAAAVSDAGGLGTVSIPGMLLEPAEAERLMRAEIDRTASLTDRNFAVNVPVGFGPEGEPLPPTAAYLTAVIDARGDPAIGD